MDYKNYNDYELVYMVRENDDDSKDILLKKYNPVIISIAQEFYERYKNYGYEYDDFYQEAMISFQKAIITYNDNKDSILYTFVNVCIRRNLQSFCRNISSNRKSFLSSCVDIDDYDISDIKSNLNDNFDYLELAKICNKVIFELPSDVSAILELKLNGFTFNEIATLLDIPRSTAEFKSRCGRRLLKRYLRKYYCK